MASRRSRSFRSNDEIIVDIHGNPQLGMDSGVRKEALCALYFRLTTRIKLHKWRCFRVRKISRAVSYYYPLHTIRSPEHLIQLSPESTAQHGLPQTPSPPLGPRSPVWHPSRPRPQRRGDALAGYRCLPAGGRDRDAGFASLRTEMAGPSQAVPDLDGR